MRHTSSGGASSLYAQTSEARAAGEEPVQIPGKDHDQEDEAEAVNSGSGQRTGEEQAAENQRIDPPV
jgi:hypothetical protein